MSEHKFHIIILKTTLATDKMSIAVLERGLGFSLFVTRLRVGSSVWHIRGRT